MKRLLLTGLLVAGSVSATTGYYDCSARSSKPDSYAETGYLLSLGVYGGGGFYMLDGVKYEFNENERDNLNVSLKGSDGSILYGREWASPLVSFAIQKNNGDRIIYACAPMQVNEKALKQAIDSMTYPDDK